MRSIRFVLYICLIAITPSCATTRLTKSNAEFIDVCSLGGVGDGVYDNTQIFKNLNNTISASSKDTVVVYFPEGIYKTSQGLEVYNKKYVYINGKKAAIIKSASHWNVDNVALYIVDCKIIDVSGLTVDMRINNPSTPTNIPYRYYAVWCRMDNVPAEKINIHNCTFIDNLSVPNSTVKPYNGTIWLGSYGTRGHNATICENVFENSCGRVIYTTNMTNIRIEGNTIKNASCLSYDCKNINQELICFRQIGCDDVIIRKNRLTMSPNAYRFASHKIFEINCNDYDYQPLRNCVIAGNYVDCTNAPDDISCMVFHFEAGDTIKCERNTILLNRYKSSYLAHFNSTQDYHVMKNVVIMNNEVSGAMESSILIKGTKGVENVSVERNKFYVDKSFIASRTGDSTGAKSVRMKNNRILR